jgi:hypothetical protein
MGSAHPSAAYAASQEGSGNLNKLFKKSMFSCGFEAAMKDGYTIVASINGLRRRLIAQSRTAGRATGVGIIAAEPADAHSAGLTKR